MEPDATLLLGNLVIDGVSHEEQAHLDYSLLYQSTDEFEQLYSWTDKPTGALVTGTETAFSCSLRSAVARLDLLGYSFDKARDLHEAMRLRRSAEADSDEWGSFIPPFDALAESVHLIDVSTVSPEAGQPWGKQGAWAEAATLLESLLGMKVPEDEPVWERESQHALRWSDPFLLLQLLAQNEKNLEFPVIWHPANDVIDNWAESRGLETGVKRQDRFQIVTEGSSDTEIIKKALALLRPNVAHLFDFIDMDKNYPFTGVGNLHNFYQGLLKIGILNSMVVVYDNDAAGTAKYDAAVNLPALPNIRVLKLPDVPAFEEFLTVGPTGEQQGNINGQAVSIECFLDLDRQSDRLPRIRWTSYDEKSHRYQGELEGKNRYLKQFLKLTQDELLDYDTTKLELVLEMILTECRSIALARPNEVWISWFQ
jgi:hypothetical protein